MNEHLRARRDRWLKLSPDTWAQINQLHGEYIESEIENYAIYKLAQERITDLQGSEKWTRWQEVLLNIALILLGVTLFSLLPQLGLSKTGLSAVLLIAVSAVVGPIIIYFSHNVVSSLLTQQMLFSQYNSALNKIVDEESNSTKVLEQCFLQNKRNYLKKFESTKARPPSMRDWGLAIFSIGLEIAAIWIAFTKNDSDGESINYVLMLIAMATSIFILISIAYYTSKHKHLLEINDSLVSKYSEEEDKIIRKYDQLLEF
ncbi:MAG: hypothetical protein WCO45_03810 [Pseudanabaena sp. ELA607]|jgi:hypothetical protein